MVVLLLKMNRGHADQALSGSAVWAMLLGVPSAPGKVNAGEVQRDRLDLRRWKLRVPGPNRRDRRAPGR